MGAAGAAAVLALALTLLGVGASMTNPLTSALLRTILAYQAWSWWAFRARTAGSYF